MTRSEFHRLLLNAQDTPDYDTYLIECGGSLPSAYYTDDCDPDNAVRVLQIIWELRDNLTFSAVRRISGFSQAEFSSHYSIPRRTIENWDSGVNTPPPYLAELLAADVITEQFEIQY